MVPYTLYGETHFGQIEVPAPDVGPKLFYEFFACRPQFRAYRVVKQLEAAVVAGIGASVFVILSQEVEVFC